MKNPATLTKDIFSVIVFVMAWLNSLLVQNGHKPIPVLDEAQVSWIVTFVVSVWAMFKDSPLKTLFKKKEVPAPVTPIAESPKPISPPTSEPATAKPVEAAEQPAEPRAPQS